MIEEKIVEILNVAFNPIWTKLNELENQVDAIKSYMEDHDENWNYEYPKYER